MTKKIQLKIKVNLFDRYFALSLNYISLTGHVCLFFLLSEIILSLFNK